MENIKVLLWDSWGYLHDAIRMAGTKFGITCKMVADFGFEFEASYNSQEIFDRIFADYAPDIIVLCQITSRNLCIDIPENIKVISYYDHFIEELCVLGEPSFAWLPKNNYIYMPILDAENFDRDGVLKNTAIREKLFFGPFLHCVREGEVPESKADHDRYFCDLSVISNYKDIDYYYGFFGVYDNGFAGRILIRFIGELANVIRQEIKANESAYMEDEKMQEIIVRLIDCCKITDYIRDVEEFIKYWFNALKYCIVPHEYCNCVIDWLIEGGYCLKIYGVGWEKNERYRKYAFGAVDEGSGELRKVYRYSKINVGNNITMGIHRRNFEAMENGCLCFQAEAVRSWLASDYRHYFEDGKSIVIYHNKRELYEKIDFYLANDEERKKIKDEARKVLKACPDIADVFGNLIRAVYEKK